MANQDQLDILRRGPDAWNAYRDDHPDLPIDLRGADLPGADLPGAYLLGANLLAANLMGADLLAANLQEADLREAKLQEANLQGANLQGANLQKAYLLGAYVESVKSQEGPVPASWDFTDLSTCLFLTQTQLNSMKGDSGTIIPDDLERPAHWPELDLGPNVDPEPNSISSKPSDELVTTLVDQLANASPVEYGLRNGKLYPGDRPLDARPLVDNPTDLGQRVQAQRTLIVAIRDELSEGSHNLDIAALLRWLDRYETTLNLTPITWYETDDAIEQIQGILVEQDAVENWPRRQFSPCDKLCKRHKEMEPLLRPEQPEAEGAAAPPLAHLSEEIGDGASVSGQLRGIADSEALAATAEASVKRQLTSLAEEIDNIRNQDAFTPGQEDKNKRSLLKSLTKTSTIVAAFVRDIGVATAGGVTVVALTNTQAAGVVLEQMRALLDLLLTLF